ncbi:MAG: 50S ribosomal protein L35 [Defluviitaleaceae bacterium]|nr:50S ribosomal protein L35 [Defluviitaleaceae bacterium]
MPKLKTKKAAAKRFTATGTGEFKYQNANKRHLLGPRSPKRKRQLRRTDIVDKSNHAQVKQMLPYA